MRNVLVIVVLAGLPVACGGDDNPASPTTTTTTTSVSVTFSAETIRVGDTVQFEARETLSNGQTRIATSATWGSDNPAVATVSQTGLVTAVDVGTATIFADVNPRGTVLIEVMPADDLPADDDPQVFRLTVSTTGDGQGTVTSTPAGITCGNDCDATYAAGTVVNLTATPNGGSTFGGWSGHGDCSNGRVTMSGARRCTATFMLQTTASTFTLAVVKAGDGEGTVTSSPPGIACGNDCEEAYNAGTVVSLIAAPVTGSTFAGWSGNSDCENAIVTMSVDRNCTATFNLASSSTSFTLTVSTSGASPGTVTSNDGGISCPGDCMQDYGAGIVVTLTATPDGPFGSSVSWTGACAGTNPVTTVTMSADKSCTAVLEPVSVSET